MVKELSMKDRARVLDITQRADNWQLVEVERIVQDEVRKRILAS